jgi:hypothetical protein
VKYILTILTFLFVPAVCLGQTPTTSQIVYSGLNSIPAPGTGVLLNNIGQGAHMIVANERDAPAHTCATGAGNPGSLIVSLEFTFGNSAGPWFLLSQITGDNGTVDYVKYATGVFPGLRISVYGFDTTNCVVDVNYMGSLYPVGTIPSEFNGYFSAQCPASVCQNTTNHNAGNTVIATIANFSSSAHLGKHISIYSVEASNISAGAETFTIGFSTLANACSPMAVGPQPGNSGQYLPITLAIGSTTPQYYILPSSTAPYITGGPTPSAGIPPPQSICISFQANASGHNFTVNLTYRIEP